MSSSFSPGGCSVRFGSQETCLPLAGILGRNNHTTYQRFTGTLEHVTDVLAQARLWGLPTDKAKVVHMLYALAGKEVVFMGICPFTQRCENQH